VCEKVRHWYDVVDLSSHWTHPSFNEGRRFSGSIFPLPLCLAYSGFFHAFLLCISYPSDGGSSLDLGVWSWCDLMIPQLGLAACPPESMGRIDD